MEDYRQKLEDFIRKETVSMIERNLTEQIASRIRPFVGKGGRGLAAKKSLGVSCPICGGDIETTPFGYGCSNYKRDGSGCKFSIGTIAGRDLAEEEVKTLLKEGKTGVLKGFLSKTKKRFNAALMLEKDEEGKVSVTFDFSQNEPEILEGLSCPVCGAALEITPFGYSCVKHHENPDECYFSIGKLAGKALSVDDLTTLLTEGRTETIRGFKSKTGKKFDACVALVTEEDGRKVLKFDFDHVEAKKVKDVVCPLCGGDIIQTPFGFGCANYSKDNPESCRFSIGKMAEKALNESQVKQLLTEGRTGTIRGFKSKAGKKFDARVALNKDENGKVSGLKFDFTDLEAQKLKDVVCPLCGGDIVKTPFGYGCANYSKDNQESCRFSVGQIAGVKLKDAEVKELLTRGKTGVIQGFVAKTGMKFDAPLKITAEGQITFDFPEKPKPVDTTVPCPRCGKLLMKSQWYYECECGFKVSHTVAKVSLSEEIIKELFETGKTRAKVTGFVSKAGNQFDTCLKYEDERISFDFDNPGEKPEESIAKEDSFAMYDDMARFDSYAENMAAEQALEAEEQLAGSNFLDEFMS